MNNADRFKQTFGIYAEEFWSFDEKQMLDWLNADVPDTNVGDTISRQAAIDAMIEWYGCEPSDIDDFKKILAKQPSAQPERKKGKWINDGKGLYKCTACGELWIHWWATVMPIETMYKEMRFCPHCGADMRKETEDD